MWSECIDPRFLDLGTSRTIVSFTHRPLYPRGKDPDTHWIGGSLNPVCVYIYIQMCQDRDQWSALLNTAMNLQVLERTGSFLIEEVSLSFSYWALLG
jgi:hypothetical protein